MPDGPTIEKLKEMKFMVMAEMLADPDTSFADLFFEDRFAIMVDAQWLAKRNARIKRLLLPFLPVHISKRGLMQL